MRSAQDERHHRGTRPEGNVADAGPELAGSVDAHGRADLREQRKHGSRLQGRLRTREVGLNRIPSAAGPDRDHPADPAEDHPPQRGPEDGSPVAEPNEARLAREEQGERKWVHPSSMGHADRDPASRRAAVARPGQVLRALQAKPESEHAADHPADGEQRAVQTRRLGRGRTEQAERSPRRPGSSDGRS